MHANARMPRLSGDTILFDIDETITYAKLEAVSETGSAFLDALQAVVMQVHGLDSDQAPATIHREFAELINRKISFAKVLIARIAAGSDYAVHACPFCCQ